MEMVGYGLGGTMGLYVVLVVSELVEMILLKLRVENASLVAVDMDVMMADVVVQVC